MAVVEFVKEKSSFGSLIWNNGFACNGEPDYWGIGFTFDYIHGQLYLN